MLLPTPQRAVLSTILLLGIVVCRLEAQDLQVEDMSFVDDQHGWVAVREPTPAIFRTSDGGRTWDHFSVPPRNGFSLLRFFDRNSGIATEIESDQATAIYRTRDGGETWTKVSEVKTPYQVIFVGLYLTSPNEGFLVGEGEGGTGYVVQLLSAGETLEVREDQKSLSHFAQRPDTLGVFGDGTGHVWIVGDELILHSADGGKKWENQSLNAAPKMGMAISGTALPGGYAWIAAENEIYRTNDYGKHWLRVLTTKDEVNLHFPSISFASPNDGCAVGSSAFIYCTKDGGVTWSRSEVFNTYPTNSPFFPRLQLFGSSHGWASIDGALYKTENGGDSFTEVLTATAPVKSDVPGEFQALTTWINGPADLAYDAEGFLYIVEREQGRLLRLDTKHDSIKVVFPELTPRNNWPEKIAADQQANLFIGDFNGQIRKLDTSSGDITVLLPFHPDLSNPLYSSSVAGLAVDRHDNLLITIGHQLFELRTGSTKLGAIAGTGDGGYTGDGESAIKAKLNWPRGVAIGDNGDIFISDYQNCRIRKISAETQIITTIAGTGECASKGDGGPAVEAAIDYPQSMAIDHKGNLFFVDHQSVRRIDSQGIITTYAGTGKGGESGDGGPAEKAELDGPSGIALDSDGGLYIAEFSGNRIRYVNPVTHIITTAAGNGKPERVDIQM